jgi:formylglycine-generating enzyme required for sulfatase activity/dienelactone hydrolase
MQESLLEVQSLAQEGRYFAAFRLARSIEEEAGDVPGLAPLWPLFTEEIDIETEPPGAEVLIEDPPGGETPALALGSTPLRAVRVPPENLRWRFDKAEFSPAERVARFDTPVFWGTSTETGRTRITVKLSPDASENSEMVRVLGGRVDVRSAGLGSPPILLVGDFWIDRHEVNNREFKSFVQGGGYAERRYWKVPFLRDGKKVSWEEAMAAFVDATGRPGPLLWEFSDYPKGQDDFPVTGVSWYEAAAYAEFVGKQLPTVYHWSRAGWNGSQAIPASNFSGEPAAAGTHNGISAFGAYDMFGNAKEWCWNATSDIEEFRYLIGGGWHEPSYRAGQVDATSAFDRSPQHGFRLATELDSDGTDAAAFAPLARGVRDYTKTKPVSDETFELYASLYNYDAGELAATVEPVEAATDYWRREKAEINAAYDGERMPVHLFFPTSGAPPWQVVIFFPGAGAFRLYPDLTNLELVEALVRGGRAVAYPVYESSYERAKGDNTELYRPNPGTVFRDHVITVAKDVGRAIDYIEARPDLDANKIAYVGLSRGAALGPINLAIEKRFKAAALVVGGLWQDQVRPEVDQINFCPRVTLPVLMVNGAYDFIFPVENSQRPMFEMLGTAPEHKKHVLLEGGHGLPRHEVVRELSVWLDRYLGTPGG